MKLNSWPIVPTTRTNTEYGSRIVVNGYSNLVSGVEAEARRTVEAKYADQWNAAGLVRRWKLQRMMNVEIKELVADLMPEVSPDANF